MKGREMTEFMAAGEAPEVIAVPDWQQRFEHEHAARKLAEQILREKTRDLHQTKPPAGFARSSAAKPASAAALRLSR